MVPSSHLMFSIKTLSFRIRPEDAAATLVRMRQKQSPALGDEGRGEVSRKDRDALWGQLFLRTLQGWRLQEGESCATEAGRSQLVGVGCTG